MSSLGDLFPPGDYRLHLTLHRGEPGRFFASTDSTGSVLAERQRWLAEAPGRYGVLAAAGVPLLEEFAALLAGWGVCAGVERRVAPDEADPVARLRRMGAALEPDFLLLSREPDGDFRLCGGALCFPTSWALEEKLGCTMDEIHAPVPGLNSALGPPIRQFLARLKPGPAYFRENWGIAASDALNLHPARGVPPPMPPVDLTRLWLRVEHQMLAALPGTGGMLFGIRIALHRLDVVARDRTAALRLRRALATMPAELRTYKRLDAISAELEGALG